MDMPVLRILKTACIVSVLTTVCATSLQADDQLSNNEVITTTNMLDITSKPWTTHLGASFLKRNKKGIQLEGYTTGLNPGSAHSIWWVIYNEPSNCVDGGGNFNEVGCNIDEVVNQDLAKKVGTSLMWAGGFISDSNGSAFFRAELMKNQKLGEVMLGDGLKRPMNAEIHFLIREHGPLQTGMVDKQISTFGGGCGEDAYPCKEVQRGIHPVPELK